MLPYPKVAQLKTVDAFRARLDQLGLDFPVDDAMRDTGSEIQDTRFVTDVPVPILHLHTVFRNPHSALRSVADATLRSAYSAEVPSATKAGSFATKHEAPRRYAEQSPLTRNP